MSADPRGRWFRVYARQISEHPKFRELTGVELGAWTALRAEAELRDRAIFRDEAEAVLVLRRRRIPRPAAVLERLVRLRLFDVLADGGLTVHDRADHDRKEYPSDDPEEVRRRKAEERARKKAEEESRAGHEDVTTRDSESHDIPARGEQAEPAPAFSQQPQPQPADSLAGLPSDDDSATVACRLFLNGGRWLGDREYVAAWDELDRRYTAAWVRSEIQTAYRECQAESLKVKPWELVHATELRCAIRARAEERQREVAQAEAAKRAAEANRLRAEAASEEERERASMIRRAIGLWIRKRPTEPVPVAFDDLKAWLEQNETDEPQAGAA